VEHRLFDHGARAVARCKGQIAREQLEQHHAQREHIGRRADGLAQDLLGRSVAQREPAAGLAGEVSVHRAGVVQQAGDAEVQQLGCAVRGDHHIGRLQVAVHDELRMRVVHALGHADQQAHALRHGGAFAVHVGAQRAAGHKLQHQVGLAVVGDAGIQQARYGRVVQARQHGTLTGKAGGEAGGGQIAAQQLDGRLRLEQAIGPPCQPHLAHAAGTDLVHQLPRSHALARLRRVGLGRTRGGCVQRGRQVALEHRQVRLQRSGFAIAQVGAQHGLQLIGQLGIALAQGPQPGRAVGRQQRQGLIEQGRQLLPTVAVDHRPTQTSWGRRMRHIALPVAHQALSQSPRAGLAAGPVP